MHWLILFTVVAVMTGVFGFTGIPVSAGAVVEIILVMLLIVIGGWMIKQFTFKTNDPI